MLRRLLKKKKSRKESYRANSILDLTATNGRERERERERESEASKVRLSGIVSRVGRSTRVSSIWEDVVVELLLDGYQDFVALGMYAGAHFNLLRRQGIR